ncbi:MAG: hypothetical protein CMH57_10515 [Myxococcales bacterium]|nr:hypothetical protein [Myxococcales bacterium]
MSLGFDNARHLLSRAGFGGDLKTIERYAAARPEEAARALLRGVRVTSSRPLPGWVNQAAPSRKERRANRKAFQKKRRNQAAELKHWWYQEMIATPSPLTERMTLFWHNHFTSSLRKVRFPPLMARQNALLRRHALGSFRDLLHAIARDPAMIVYLDGQTNRKRKPNENFARELLELFTLGEGHYSERDIKEAARAFTGWRVDRKTGRFEEAPRRHDGGVKTFLGRTGRFKGGDVLDILLEQPRTAEYITTRLWRALVSSEPDPTEIKRLAAVLRGSNYAIAPTVEAMLSSKAFFAPERRGAMIKSPVDLVVGTLRAFKLPLPSEERYVIRIGRRLGQDLFDPPNVKGWPGHEAWITTHTLLLRHRQLTQFVRGAFDKLPDHGPEALKKWLGRPDLDAAGALEMTTRVLLPIAPVHGAPNPNVTPSRLLGHLVLDPAYQLK